MHILLIQLALNIPLSQSLKDKRRHIKSLKDKISHRFNASIAEVDYLDTWKKSVLAICMVSNDKSYLDKQYGLIESLVLEFPDLQIANISREWL